MPNGGVFTQAPQDELRSLITEREWVEARMATRIKMLADQHLQTHAKLPNVLFVPDPFWPWLNGKVITLQMVGYHGQHGNSLGVFAALDDILAVGYREIDYTQPQEKLPLADLMNVQGLRTLVAEQGTASRDRFYLTISGVEKGEASD